MSDGLTKIGDALGEDKEQNVSEHPIQAFRDFAQQVERGDEWLEPFSKILEKVATNTVIDVDKPDELRAYALRVGHPVTGRINSEEYYKGKEAASGVISQTVVADPRKVNIGSDDTVEGYEVRDPADVVTKEKYTSEINKPDDEITLNDIVANDDVTLESEAPITDVSTGVNVGQLRDDIEDTRKMINSSDNWTYEESKHTETANELWTLLKVDAYIDAGGRSNHDDSIDGGYFRDEIMAVKANAESIANSPSAMGIVFAADEV